MPADSIDAISRPKDTRVLGTGRPSGQNRPFRSSVNLDLATMSALNMVAPIPSPPGPVRVGVQIQGAFNIRPFGGDAISLPSGSAQGHQQSVRPVPAQWRISGAEQPQGWADRERLRRRTGEELQKRAVKLLYVHYCK